MRDLESALTLLKEKGYRLTPIRTAIIQALFTRTVPVSAADMLSLLAASQLHAHKTTVFRELSFLKHEGIVREVQLNERQKRYEIATDHHHHAICIDCDQVEDVVLGNDLAHEEQTIFTKQNFEVVRHSLEFYGVCARCRSK